MSSLRTTFLVLLLGAALATAACGGGHHGDVYVEETIIVHEVHGDAEADNQTDLTGTFENMYHFDLAPAGTGQWTPNLLGDVVFPGEIVFVGTFLADFYDAGAELDLGWVDFFDVPIDAGFTTTFEVY